MKTIQVDMERQGSTDKSKMPRYPSAPLRVKRDGSTKGQEKKKKKKEKRTGLKTRHYKGRKRKRPD